MAGKKKSTKKKRTAGERFDMRMGTINRNARKQLRKLEEEEQMARRSRRSRRRTKR